MGEIGLFVFYVEIINGGDLFYLKFSFFSRKAKVVFVVFLVSFFFCGFVLGYGVRIDRAVFFRFYFWFLGYFEDGGAFRGEVIFEYEFATGLVRFDDENEFFFVSIRNF